MWRDLVPSAMALLPMHAPHTSHFPLPVDAAVPSFGDYVTHPRDSIGIRSRAAVMADLLTERALAVGGGAWLSLACGAALPVLEVAATLDATVTVDLVDLDPLALSYADGFAEALGLGEWVRCTQADLLDLAGLPDAVPGEPGGYDVVEMMGFFEYLPDSPREVGTMTIPSAGQFLTAAMSLAVPGGLVVFGNMLTTHPQIDFILKVVQWPYVRPRSLDELAELVASAGVDSSQATFYTPDDGVYAIVAIQVPG